jgi:hypothetical protein
MHTSVHSEVTGITGVPARNGFNGLSSCSPR